MTNLLAVNEIFGPTFQGEGPSTGRRAVFLRLSMCNLKCTWCDTKYTWDWENYSRSKEIHLMTVNQIAKQIDQMDPNRDCILIITGGEPMLQQKNLLDLIGMSPREVEIETNGTIKPFGSWATGGVRYNVSPKLSGSGNPRSKAFNYEALVGLRDEGARFKFVITNGKDLEEAATMVMECRIPDGQVWLMPEGTDAHKLLQSQDWVAERANALGWNFTTRLHVLLWGNTRAR